MIGYLVCDFFLEILADHLFYIYKKINQWLDIFFWKL